MEDCSDRAENPVHATPSATADRVVVAAVNQCESTWFLEAEAPHAAAAQGFSLHVLTQNGDTPSLREVMELNPEVLLTCWSTPLLPEDWLESPGCHLRYLCHLTGSVRHVVSRRFIERGGLVTNWGAIPSTTVAEQALLLALAALRNMGRWPEIFRDAASASVRMQHLQTRTLFGRRVGLHGFGKVAQALVELLAPFNVSVSAYSPGVPPDLFAAAGVTQAPSLRHLFATSDVLFECEGLTARTQLSVQAAELAAMPDGSVLVNVARAGLIDETALLREASSGRIRVALDVFASEPLRTDSPWFRTPGAVLSPHIAGPTFDQYAECTRAAFANVHRYFAGQPLHSVVSTEVYDRST